MYFDEFIIDRIVAGSNQDLWKCCVGNPLCQTVGEDRYGYFTSILPARPQTFVKIGLKEKDDRRISLETGRPVANHAVIQLHDTFAVARQTVPIERQTRIVQPFDIVVGAKQFSFGLWSQFVPIEIL